MKDFEKFIEEVEKIEKTKKPCSTPYTCGKTIKPNIQTVLLDIDINHNHSWALEMYERNKEALDAIALYYRGVKITYKEMFSQAYKYAKSLKQMGFKKESEIPICMTNTPEFIYLFLATNLIGAKANIVGDWFNKQYLIEILNKTNSKIMFIDDIYYDDLKEVLETSQIEQLVCFSLTDSLKKDKEGLTINPYAKLEDLFHQITNHLHEIKNVYKGKILDITEFQRIGQDYKGNIIEKTELDDVCSITYTSGTTNPGYPKGVMQSNRSYITLSRFKESDVSGMPTMKNMTILAHIPTYTHMELSCAISDTFYCGCTLALEPFYDKDFFPYSLLINKPNFVPSSVGFWIHLCKLLNFDESWKKVNMPFLMIPTVTGEACSTGEEKFLNYTARKHKFGTEKLPFPLAPVTFSIGGGTTESSGIFVTLFKTLQEKKLNHLIKKETLGLTPHKFAEIEVLDENGYYCEKNMPGLLVTKNPCEMIGYIDEQATKEIYVIDAYGKRWLSLGTYSYKDSTGRIKMKGRMGSDYILEDGRKIPYYLIEDIVLKDTKNIMSCTVVKINENLVCHIEFQPYKKKNKEEIINALINRISNIFPAELTDKLYFRFRSNEESFPLDPSGKRSISTLKQIELDEKTISFNEIENKVPYKKDEPLKVLKKNR